MFVTTGQAAKLVGVSTSTLRRWEREKKISCASLTSVGHRRYLLSKLKEAVGLVKDPKSVVAYARVFSSDQKDDLERQKKDLQKDFVAKTRRQS